MESIEALVRLLAAFMAASLAPTPQYVDPGADLRMPLFSQSAPAPELTGVSRWQQVDELPSDLPDDENALDDVEALDADLEGSGATALPTDEPLDVPRDDSLVVESLIVNELVVERIVVQEIVTDSVVDDALADEELVEDEFDDGEFIDEEFADDEFIDEEFADDEFIDDEEFIDDSFADEPLDAELDNGDFVDDEFFDEEFVDDELIDDPALASDEPLDVPLADTFVDDTATLTGGPAPAQSSRQAVLPDGFGSGQTIVSNPPAGGEAAAVPGDCDAVVQNGRAVVGVGCGSDDGPWWAPLVGQSHPATTPGTGSATGTEFPFNQSGFPPGFPFDDGSGPFASDGGGVIIASPSRSGDDPEAIGRNAGAEVPRVPISIVNVERSDTGRGERIERRPDRDNERAEAIRRQRADIVDGIPAGRRAEQTSRSGLRTASQPANARQAKQANARTTANANAKRPPDRAGANLNPCQNAKRIARKPKSTRNDKQLAKARANCRQFKKTQQGKSGR